MKIAVYTAIIGDYDECRPPAVINEDVDYICFADEPMEPIGPWQIRQVPATLDSPRRYSRLYKILSHAFLPEAEYTLYHDGNIRLRIDPQEAFDRWLVDHDMAVLAHPHRQCIYEEARCCMEGDPDYEPEKIRAQMKRYKAQGYPENNGLVASTIILRRHTKSIKAFNEAWWTEVRYYSVRDQLSFNYVAWKLGIGYDVIPGNLFEHEDFDYLDHAKGRGDG